MRCLLCGCSEFEDDVKLHCFPMSPQRLKIWLESMEIPHLPGNRNSYRICSKHFTLESYANFQRKRLLRNAVPTLFPCHVEVPSSPKMSEEAAIPISNAEALQLVKSPEPATKEFIFQQTMYRIKDPKISIPFYSGVLGMSLLQKLDFPEMKFSLYFMGFEDPASMPGELGSKERSTWALSRPATVELTHNWGTESQEDFKYHNGNAEPKGFGHIGLMVPDVDKACERFEQLKVNFVKRPQDGKMKTIAFITDPDGYWIEIFNNKNV